VWVESLYSGQPAQEVVRGSKAYKRLMEKLPKDAELRGLTGTVVFSIEGRWYRVVDAPAKGTKGHE